GKSPPVRDAKRTFPLYLRLVWKEPTMEMAVENPVTMNPVANPLNAASPVGHEDRKGTAQRIANEMFHQQPDWITFFREVLGVDGLLRKLLASPAKLSA